MQKNIEVVMFGLCMTVLHKYEIVWYWQIACNSTLKLHVN